MVTFEQARQLVRDLEEPTFAGPGTYMVADWGREDATHFQVVTGAREDLVDHDPAYRPLDAPVWFVDKVTGTVDQAVYLPGNLTAGKLEAMTVVGDAPPRPEAVDLAELGLEVDPDGTVHPAA